MLLRRFHTPISRFADISIFHTLSCRSMAIDAATTIFSSHIFFAFSFQKIYLFSSIFSAMPTDEACRG